MVQGNNCKDTKPTQGKCRTKGTDVGKATCSNRLIAIFKGEKSVEDPINIRNFGSEEAE